MKDYTIEFFYSKGFAVKWVQALSSIQAIHQIEKEMATKGEEIEILSVNLHSVTHAMKHFFHHNKQY